MNHLAAFLLRLTFQAAAAHAVPFVDPEDGPAVMLPAGTLALLDAADRYDSWMPIETPAWLSAVNAPGGEA